MQPTWYTDSYYTEIGLQLCNYFIYFCYTKCSTNIFSTIKFKLNFSVSLQSMTDHDHGYGG